VVRSVNNKNWISAAFAAVILIIFSAFIGMFTFGGNVMAKPIVPGVPWSAIVEPVLIIVILLISVTYSFVIGRGERLGGKV
jgi:uncharacterized membrane protein (DUF485 family)